MSATSIETRPTLPLTLASPGETVTVADVRLNGDEKQRLQELGLFPGAKLRIVKSDPTHGLIVSICQDGRLALNHGTARKLMVFLER